jgi:hypothetical protein
MPDLVTSIHHQYQPDLDVLWALREIGSNAFDGERRNADNGTGAMTVEYNRRAQRLVVTNAGVEVPTTALLMGTSQSRENDECIGQFGEGLPMACMVLARNRHNVVIRNQSVRWTPVIERHASYDHEPVLVIKQRKARKAFDGFEVAIDGISETMYEEFRGLYLQWAEDDVRESFLGKSYKGTLILHPAFRGRIYNKGVYVTSRDDLIYGYDLNLELNRDRTFIRESLLKSELAAVLNGAQHEGNEAFNRDLVAKMFSNDALELRNEYSDLCYNGELADDVMDKFRTMYGDKAYPVANEDEADRITEVGMNPVYLAPATVKLLRMRIGSISILETSHNKSFVKWSLFEDADITTEERDNLRLAMDLIRLSGPNQAHLGRDWVLVADFVGSDVEWSGVMHPGGELGEYAAQPDVYEALQSTIAVSRSCLSDFSRLLKILVAGLCRVNTTSTDDVFVSIIRCIALDGNSEEILYSSLIHGADND